MAKGASFERAICKELSLWWTGGERDDVFWRSSQSGGRATVRARAGKRTAGSYGDICALDPIGEPFTRVFTIELKRGEYVKHPGDLLDCSGSMDCHPFLGAIRQAEEARAIAGSRAWLLIVRRDRKRSTIFFPSDMVKPGQPFFTSRFKLLSAPVFRYRLKSFDFTGMTLEKFLASVKPAHLASFA